MIWIQFLAIALVIVVAGVRLARYGGETGLGRELRQMSPQQIDIHARSRPCN